MRIGSLIPVKTEVKEMRGRRGREVHIREIQLGGRETDIYERKRNEIGGLSSASRD